MELINLKGLNLTMEESRDIIKFITQKRGISTKNLLSTIKPNLKRKNSKMLTNKTQQKLIKTHQKLIKTQQKLIKTHQQKVAKTQQRSLKFQKHKNTKNLTYEKPSKLAKRENLTSQKSLKTTKQQILSNTKKKNRNYKRKT